MTRWYAWFKGEAVEPYIRFILADGMETAELIANDYASRAKVRFVGLIVSPAEGEKSPEE